MKRLINSNRFIPFIAHIPTTFNAMDSLSLYDKIHLAECAARRSKDHWNDQDRFLGEFNTVVLWKKHRITSTKTITGELLNFISGY